LPVYETGVRVRGGLIFAIAIVLLILFGARTGASWVLDYEWWKEMGQMATWISMLIYGVAPIVAAAVVAFFAFWVAHARALKSAGTGLRAHPTYARLSTLAIALFAILFATAAIDSWTVVRYFGGGGAATPAGAWHDPVYGRPLPFYLFDLSFALCWASR
jgi:hypothetical protein